MTYPPRFCRIENIGNCNFINTQIHAIPYSSGNDVTCIESVKSLVHETQKSICLTQGLCVLVPNIAELSPLKAVAVITIADFTANREVHPSYYKIHEYGYKIYEYGVRLVMFPRLPSSGDSSDEERSDNDRFSQELTVCRMLDAKVNNPSPHRMPIFMPCRAVYSAIDVDGFSKECVTCDIGYTGLDGKVPQEFFKLLETELLGDRKEFHRAVSHFVHKTVKFSANARPLQRGESFIVGKQASPALL